MINAFSEMQPAACTKEMSVVMLAFLGLSAQITSEATDTVFDDALL